MLPHPHVVDLDAGARACGRARARGPGPWACTSRACAPAWTRCASCPTLVEQVRAMPDARLLVNGHRDVLDEGGARRDAALAT